MAIQPDLKSLVRESLREYLFVAEYCVGFQKDAVWPQEEVGGCLGYPAAVMLFSIVDTIGSFHRGSELEMTIDGKTRKINGEGFQHFFVLNSEFYGQVLEEPTIKKLYANFRNLLTHNASLAPASFLIKNSAVAEAFPRSASMLGVNVPAFLQISRVAVHKFLARSDHVVPGSQQAAYIGLKK